MSESEPSRLQMGMGGSLPPLSLPPLSLPPIKTDPLGLSPLSYNSAINQAMHSPISTNVASPSNHVNSPQQQMFPQPPSSPLAYGNGSPRQMPMKRRFPVGQEPGVFQQRQGMESLPKQMKSLSAPSGSMPPSPMRYQEPIASPSSSYAQSPSNVPSPSTSHHLPNGNGPVHPQMHPQALKVSQASVQPMQMAHQQQPHHPMPQQIPQQGQQMPQQGVNMAEFRGTPNGTFHPSVSSAPSPNLYHKPRPVEANAQVSQQLQHLQMRPSTSHQQSMVQQAHHMQNMQNAQMQVPQMFPSQQHHMFPSQGMPGQPPVGFVQVQQGPPQQQRMAMQHPQAVHIVQQRMIPGQGVVPVVVAQPQQQQLQQQQIQQQQQQQQLQAQMSQQQIKHLLANRVNGPPPVNGPNGPGPSSTPALQQVLTRLHPGRLGQLPPSQANMPVRTILSAQQHQMANGRPGIPVSMPMQMHPSGQPMMHQVMAAPRSNPTAAMQLARMIDERMGPPTSSKEQYRAFKKKFKYLVYENECYQEELRNLQRKLLKLSRDKNFLLDRLMQFEKVSDSSDDDSDSSQKMVDDRPKTKKRVRTQKRKSSPHTDGVGSVSGTPSPCPSPAPTNNLLQVMLQQSTSSAVFSPSGEPKQPPNREEQLRMAEDRRQALLQLQNPGEREMRQPFPREPMGDPVVNGYPAGPHFPSQSSSAPAQSLSHLNGHLPSTPSAASEEIDQKPVP